MTASPQENQVEQKQNDKELNFRMLEAKYEKQLAQERAARIEAERIAQEAASRRPQVEEEDESDPYVDHKKLKKTLSNFGQNTQTEIQKAMEMAKNAAKDELKRDLWIENNPDFHDVLQNHAEKFAQRAPKLAETILRMPEGFERQKLVYQNIKELGLDRPEPKQQSIQEKVDANRRSPYYQPSGVGSAPYNAGAGDFSEAGQKNAYEKLQQLKKNLRI
jgi:hypothetical protein